MKGLDQVTFNSLLHTNHNNNSKCLLNPYNVLRYNIIFGPMEVEDIASIFKIEANELSCFPRTQS